MSIMARRKHNKANRKVASFGLAFGSKLKIVENFKPVMLKYLNHIFEQTSGEHGEVEPKVEQQKIEQIIKELYNLVNENKL